MPSDKAAVSRIIAKMAALPLGETRIMEVCGTHSMAIAKAINFRPGTEILDFGCGGGFPGIPLAILFPNVQFHLVDSIGKKIKVAQEIAQEIGLGK